MRIGFDHDKYTAMQSEHILNRIAKFGGKLYLELGGKLFDDTHASRVLPGFRPDSKVSMLLKSPFLPVARGDLNISGADAQMPLVLVMDGRIMGENLVSIGRDAKWLARVIRNSAHCGIDDVFFASVGEGRKLFIQDKRGSKPVQVALNWDKRS